MWVRKIVVKAILAFEVPNAGINLVKLSVYLRHKSYVLIIGKNIIHQVKLVWVLKYQIKKRSCFVW